MKEQMGCEGDGEVVIPLLPEIQSPADPGPKGASLSSAVFNISTSMIGAGIMSIPATFKVLGIIPALLVILVVAFLGDVTGEFLLRYTHTGKATTYAGLMAESFGRIGSLALQICFMITSFGCLIIYLIIIGDVLAGNQSGDTIHTGILQEWFGHHWWTTRAFALFMTTVLVLLPLVMFRRVNSLRHTSALAVLLAFVFVAISSVMAIYALCESKTQSLRLLPDFSTKGSVFSLFTTIPVFIDSIRVPNQWVALVICAIFYFAIGFFGYLLFGDSIMADVLLNFDMEAGTTLGGIINDTIRISYAVHLMLVFPLINYPLRANISELLFPRKSHLDLDTPRFTILTCALLVLSYVLAIAIPDMVPLSSAWIHHRRMRHVHFPWIDHSQRHSRDFDDMRQSGSSAADNCCRRNKPNRHTDQFVQLNPELFLSHVNLLIHIPGMCN